MIGNIIDFFKSAQAPDGKTVWLVIGIFAGAWLLMFILGVASEVFVRTRDSNYWFEHFDAIAISSDVLPECGNNIFLVGLIYTIFLKVWVLIPIVAHIAIWAITIYNIYGCFTSLIALLGSLFSRRVKLLEVLSALSMHIVFAIPLICTYIVYFR